MSVYVEDKVLETSSGVEKRVPALVVSSELKNCCALRDILDQQGWESICVSTVRDCHEVLASQNIALVFCDRCLADGSYRDILFTMHLLGRRMSLIVISRLADWGEYFEALGDGASDLIASPIQTADIVRVIRLALPEGQQSGSRVLVRKAQTTSATTQFDPRNALPGGTIEDYPLSPIQTKTGRAHH